MSYFCLFSLFQWDPKFLTKPATFVVDRGTTISLPCVVDKLPREYSIFTIQI